jgi:hypothetical protein
MARVLFVVLVVIAVLMCVVAAVVVVLGLGDPGLRSVVVPLESPRGAA